MNKKYQVNNKKYYVEKLLENIKFDKDENIQTWKEVYERYVQQ